MERKWLYTIVCAVAAVVVGGGIWMGVYFSSVSGRRFERDAKRIQEQLWEQEQLGERKAEEVAACLEGGKGIEELKNVMGTEDDLLYFLFDATKIVYWSDNWITSDEIQLDRYGVWEYYHFRNAHGVGRWTQIGRYNLLIVIPIQYDYKVQSPMLSNGLKEPFRARSEVEVTRRRSDKGKAIVSGDGRYLFSLQPISTGKKAHASEDVAGQTFSFQDLFQNTEDMGALRAKSLRVRAYYMVCVLTIVLLVVWGAVGLIRHRGFRNMRLRARMMYVIMACLLLSFVYVFVLSVRYSRANYKQRQEEYLQTKCHFVQTHLKELYKWRWNLDLSEEDKEWMNVNLRDLSYSAGADIMVYGLDGMLVGTSAPRLFENGILSERIAPKPFFSNESEIVQYERIGMFRYLAAYAPFYNDAMVQIGYIAVPYFESELAVMSETDDLLAKLLPPYLIVFVLAMIVAFLAARSMTRPIEMMVEKMQNFEIGKPDNHLQYKYKDDVGDLVDEYNILVDQIEDAAQRLAKVEREGAWRTMARQIAHEINNPLTPMKLTIQQLQRLHGKVFEEVCEEAAGDLVSGVSSAAACSGADSAVAGGASSAVAGADRERYDRYFKQATAMLVEQIENLSRIASSFSAFAKQPDVVVTEVDVAQKLSQVITLQRNNDQGIPIRYVGPDYGVTAMADNEQIAQVFVNIIRNALQALEGQKDGDIIVVMTEEERTVQIKISDNGPGIPQEIQEKIFRPNFTTKNTGMGLGLAISKHIVEGAGGKICYQTSKNGTTFLVQLPKKQ